MTREDFIHKVVRYQKLRIRYHSGNESRRVWSTWMWNKQNEFRCQSIYMSFIFFIYFCDLWYFYHMKWALRNEILIYITVLARNKDLNYDGPLCTPRPGTNQVAGAGTACRPYTLLKWEPGRISVASSTNMYKLVTSALMRNLPLLCNRVKCFTLKIERYTKVPCFWKLLRASRYVSVSSREWTQNKSNR